MLPQTSPLRRLSLKKWRRNLTHFIMRVISTLPRPNSNVEITKEQLQFLNSWHARSSNNSTLSKAVIEDCFSTRPFANFKWANTKNVSGLVTLTCAHSNYSRKNTKRCYFKKTKLPMIVNEYVQGAIPEIDKTEKTSLWISAKNRPNCSRKCKTEAQQQEVDLQNKTQWKATSSRFMILLNLAKHIATPKLTI